MKEITSRQNTKLIEISKLLDKKYRDSQNTFLIEGEKMFNEAIFFNKPIKEIFARTDYFEKNSEYLSKFEEKLTLISPIAFEKISSTENSQGIIAVIEKEKFEFDPAKNLLILDNISDSGNVGGIVRSAACFGFEQIFAIGGADPFSPKSVRASMSGIFCVNISETDEESVLDYCKQNGHKIIVADANGVPFESARMRDKFALVIGNEAHGVSDIFKKNAHKILSISMKNNMESLNACVSASILMHKFKE